MPCVTHNEVTGTSQTIAANTGYIANNASQVVFTLPASPSFGDEIEICGKGAGGWKVNVSGSQSISYIDQTTSASGYISNTQQYDSVRLLCITSPNTWMVRYSVGNINVV